MKKKNTLFYIFLTMVIFPLLLSQPMPLDSGNSGEIGSHGQELGAP